MNASVPQPDLPEDDPLSLPALCRERAAESLAVAADPFLSGDERAYHRFQAELMEELELLYLVSLDDEGRGRRDPSFQFVPDARLSV